MIISHRYKFIFIHCRKVAGSAIKATLWPYLGDDDIMIGSLDEVLRRGYTLNRSAKRSLWFPKAWNVSRKAVLERLAHGDSPKYRNLINTAVKARYKGLLYHNPVHSPAEMVKNAFPREWESYFKFCIVRNPYDQAVSEYTYQMRNAGRDASFKYFLKAMRGEVDDSEIVPRGLKTNWPLYTLNDKPVADFIGRYENLEEDFSKISDKIGVEIGHPLMREKVGRRGERKPLAEWYDEETISLVQSIYGKEVDFFGYHAPSNTTF